VLFASLAILPFLTAAAPQAVVQSGVVTPTHAAMWTQTGIIQDAGVSTSGNLTTLGITANSGTPFCISNFKQPAARTQLCWGVSTSQAYLQLNSYNGAGNLPFNVILNGVSYPFPNAAVQTPLRVVATGATDTSTSADGTIAWNSATTAPKTETLYACTAGAKGNVLRIVDDIGNAATYPIVLTASAGTVNNVSTFTMLSNGQSVSLICDGISNWMRT